MDATADPSVGLDTGEFGWRLVPPGELEDAEGDNPNHMTAEKYALLLESIRKFGFVDPVLVREDGVQNEKLAIVDGHHRKRAAIELGLDMIPVVVTNLPRDMPPDVLQLAVNNIRGSIDLAVASALVAEWTGAGHTIDDLTVTGFTKSELGDLLKSAKRSTEDIINKPIRTPKEDDDEDEEPAGPRPFSLELTFSTKGDLAAVKRALRAAAGKGNELGDGLLKLIKGEA